MKKYLISSITLTMILFTTLNVNANSKIQDIQNHWANKEISNFIKNSYVKGYNDNTFKPNKQITRAEFIKIINNYFGFSEKGIPNFSDINKNEWYYDDICKAVKSGYINGYEDNTFRPNKEITREEATKIIISIKNQIDNNYDKLETFQDKHLVSNWAKPYIEGAIESGYLKGDNLKRINPKTNITRAESVSILSRTDNKIVKKIINKVIKPNTIENKENKKIDLNPKNQEDNKQPEMHNPIIPEPSLKNENENPVVYVDRDIIYVPRGAKWNNYHPDFMIDARAYDKNGKELDIEYVGYVDTNLPGKYTVTALTKDSTGKSAQKSISVIVENYYVHYVEPIIECPFTIYLKVGDNFSYDIINATARNEYEDNLSHLIKYSGKVNTEKAGLYPISVSLSDTNGNNTSRTVFVEVTD